MAVKINIPISVNGASIDAGAIVMPMVQFNLVQMLQPVPPGPWQGNKIRSITVKLPMYASKLVFQQGNALFWSFDNCESMFIKDLTDEEYNAYTPEELDVFTLEFLETQLGNDTCEIIDPYIID